MSMTAIEPFGLPTGRLLTVDDLARIPDDGYRYELIDGATVIMSPAPSLPHQTAVFELAVLLRSKCAPGLRVVIAPFAVREGIRTELQPDVLVAREEDLTDTYLPVAPQLAVEVLSPSSVINDFNDKKAAYERMGTPSYWVIDPLDPKLTVFEMDERGRYQLVAEVAGDKAFDATQPFGVRVVPAELLAKP